MERDKLEEYGSAIGGRVAVVIGEVTSIIKSISAKVRDALADVKSDSSESKE